MYPLAPPVTNCTQISATAATAVLAAAVSAAVPPSPPPPCRRHHHTTAPLTAPPHRTASPPPVDRPADREPDHAANSMLCVRPIGTAHHLLDVCARSVGLVLATSVRVGVLVSIRIVH